MILVIHEVPVPGGLVSTKVFGTVTEMRAYLKSRYSTVESNRMVLAAFARYVPQDYPDQLDLIGVRI